jgi:hypothetical protein
VLVKNLLTGTVTLASTADDGTKGDDYSGTPDLSADGTRVAFDSFATNLDADDTDTTQDVFVKNLVTADLALASAAADGTKGDGPSRSARLSRDGTKVGFHSEATNLVQGDTDTTQDVLVKDLATGAVTLASTAEDGTKGNNGSYEPSLDADGSHVAFASSATNLGEGDTDAYADVYVKGSAAAVVEPAPTCAGREATVHVAAGRIVGGPDTGQPYAGELRGTDGPDVIVGTPSRTSSSPVAATTSSAPSATPTPHTVVRALTGCSATAARIACPAARVGTPSPAATATTGSPVAARRTGSTVARDGTPPPTSGAQRATA